MNMSSLIAVAIQGLLVIWLCAGVRFRKENHHFLDEKSTMALKGYFSIVIVLFHCPVSIIFYHIYGYGLSIIIVTLFSYFSTYGMTVRLQNNAAYLEKIPWRALRIAAIYCTVILIKCIWADDIARGGVFWINNLLLSYLIFYVTHKLGLKGADYYIIGFWIMYAIVMRIFPNPYLSWPAQSLGFAYGSIAAVFREPLEKFFSREFKKITAGGLCLLPVLTIVYLYIRKPEESLPMYLMKQASSFLLVLLFLTFSVRAEVFGRWMTFCGKISLYIYLLHGLVIDLLEPYLTDGWLILMCIVVTVVLASAFYFFVEKTIAAFRKIRGSVEKKRVS